MLLVRVRVKVNGEMKGRNGEVKVKTFENAGSAVKKGTSAEIAAAKKLLSYEQKA
jgi:hypothetical protein